jgi:hypothetical protein
VQGRDGVAGMAGLDIVTMAAKAAVRQCYKSHIEDEKEDIAGDSDLGK